jgi:hypothetical protein
MEFLKTKTQPHKIDIVLIILFPVLAAILTFIFKTNFLISTFLFFGIPSFYLSLRKPGIVFKSLVFSAIFAIPFGFMIDYLAVVDKSWIIPTSVFNFRLFGLTTLDGLIWGILYIFFIVMFYEYFLDFGKRGDTVSKNIKYLFSFLLVLLIVFFALMFVNPKSLQIEYFYLKSGITIGLIPLLIFLSFFPRFWKKYVIIGVYFFGASLLHELTALYVGQWIFPGKHFIGFIEMFGLRFPFEELFFWMILCAVSVLSYYEFFADDTR